jgi:hypothetical protein
MVLYYSNPRLSDKGTGKEEEKKKILILIPFMIKYTMYENTFISLDK